MTKLIVFCADGTWNAPGQDDNGDHLPDPTNVFKLFAALEGSLRPGFKPLDPEQEKLLQEAQQPVQVAKYLHGIGNTSDALKRAFEGATGAGMLARIVRGYTFISRWYEPGDRIVVVGFSRGAYTVRALAGMICWQGLLGKPLQSDKESAYKAGIRAWYRYRRKGNKSGSLWGRVVEAAADLWSWSDSDDMKSSDFVPVESVSAVAVWDTVGSLGIPDYFTGSEADAFKFANRRLSGKVTHGLHALALDEQRLDFIPTLWDAAANVEQVVFPGAHADVGGGYPSVGNESGLSDIALLWMVEKLKLVGLRFKQPLFDPLKPDATAIAHQPWLSPPFDLPNRQQLRDFPASVQADASVASRRGQMVKADPTLAPAPYAPPNWPPK